MFWPARIREEVFSLLLAREARGERIFTFYPNDELGRIKEGAVCFMPDEVGEVLGGDYSTLITPSVASLRTEPIFIATDNTNEYIVVQGYNSFDFVLLDESYTENFRFHDDADTANGFCMWGIEGFDFTGVDERNSLRQPVKKTAEEWLDGMPVSVAPAPVRKLEFL